MKTIYDDVADDYIKYGNDLPDALLAGLEIRGIDFAGAKIADFGAGPGFLSEQLSVKGGIIDAVEPSEAFYSHAEKLFKDDNRINFNLSHAENSGLPPKTFDIVIAFRAWEWFDRREVMKEVRRILKPDGYLIIADLGFVRSSGAVRETMKVIRKSAKNYKIKSKIHREKDDTLINGFPLGWIEEWQDFNFDIRDLYKRNYKVECSHEEWMQRLKSISGMVVFKRKQRRKTLKKISSHLKDTYQDDTYRIHYEMNVVILKNKN